MTPRLIPIAAIAAGGILIASAWSGWQQQQWINQKNMAIAMDFAQLPKQHNNPLWVALGIGGLAAIGYGAISATDGSVIPEIGDTQPQPQPKKPAVRQTQKTDDVAWLKCFFASSHHVALNGSTGSGKTTLCEWAISQQESEIYLVDPKHIPHSPRWNFEPNCTDISEVPLHLKTLNERMENRRSGAEAIAPLNIIIDEWDWIAEEHGKSAISQLRKLFKVGRELGIKIWLCGQSPLAKDSGLSGSDFRNFGRIILGSEAISFCNNPQFPWDSSRFKPLAESYQKRGDRLGLFIPMVGEPSIKIIPDLSQFSPVRHGSVEPSPGSTEPMDSEWLNRLLSKDYSSPEPAEPWEPKDPLNPTEPTPESIGRAIALARLGHSQTEIIESIWGAKKGGSRAYLSAREHLQSILKNANI